MKKSIAFGILMIIVLAGIASLSMAKLYSVYSPVSKSNVPIARVSIEDIQGWLSLPDFSRWNNMDALREHLADQGYSLDEMMAKAKGMSRREMLSLTGIGKITRDTERDTLRGLDDFRSGAFMGPEMPALHNIDCDLDSKELEFELTNEGSDNWFLMDQALTTGTSLGRKYLSDSLVQAKPIKLFINNFPATSMLPKYWMGEKLFYGPGETFADACSADFLRIGKTVDCELEPVPLRGGVLVNDYMLITPNFVERGTFTCD